MPQTPHGHKHFTGTATVRDIVIGMSDGLTVPFALAAGLSGAVDATKIVITAGLAEVAAGAIAMGLGGYLAAKTDAEHYATERATEERATIEMPEQEAEEVAQVFRSYGLEEATVGTVVRAIRSQRKRWVDLMMKFELGLEKPDPKRASRSALTIAGSYIVGGMIPLAPYFFLRSIRSALIVSVIVTLLALLVFGYVKGRFTVKRPIRSAWQTVLVGGLAATAAFVLAKMINWLFRDLGGARGQVEVAAMKVNGSLEVVEVAEAASRVLYPLDLRVDTFTGGIGDSVLQVGEDVR